MSREYEPSQSAFAERLPSMMAHANIEIIPFKKVWETIDVLPAGSNVAVTSSPSKGIETTLKFVPELRKRGFNVIPHLAARSIKDIWHLFQISKVLEEQNIQEVFVIGGDNKEPIGDYSYSAKMLDDLLKLNHTIKRVGVGGYPEGHKIIKKPILMTHLKAKVEIAARHGVDIHINSQACYGAKKTGSWIDHLHRQGIDIPIYLGIPTPTPLRKLIQISKDIGVGDSLRFLILTGMLSIFKSMTYDPTGFLASLSKRPESESIKGLHIFTFNNLEATVNWQKNFKLTA